MSQSHFASHSSSDNNEKDKEKPPVHAAAGPPSPTHAIKNLQLFNRKPATFEQRLVKRRQWYGPRTAESTTPREPPTPRVPSSLDAVDVVGGSSGRRIVSSPTRLTTTTTTTPKPFSSPSSSASPSLSRLPSTSRGRPLPSLTPQPFSRPPSAAAAPPPPLHTRRTHRPPPRLTLTPNSTRSHSIAPSPPSSASHSAYSSAPTYTTAATTPISILSSPPTPTTPTTTAAKTPQQTPRLRGTTPRPLVPAQTAKRLRSAGQIDLSGYLEGPRIDERSGLRVVMAMEVCEGGEGRQQRRQWESEPVSVLGADVDEGGGYDDGEWDDEWWDVLDQELLRLLFPEPPHRPRPSGRRGTSVWRSEAGLEKRAPVLRPPVTQRHLALLDDGAEAEMYALMDDEERSSDVEPDFEPAMKPLQRKQGSRELRQKRDEQQRTPPRRHYHHHRRVVHECTGPGPPPRRPPPPPPPRRYRTG